MQRLAIVFLLLTLLVACGPGNTLVTTTNTLGPTDTPAATTAPADTATPVRPSPMPLPEPTATPHPSPTPPPRQPAWWDDTVFYQVFVRSFFDSNGDGNGDLQGLIERLGHIEELGVTGLWLMPIFDSPSYHGYDVIDYLKTNPDYGVNEDFQKLMDEAHARGIRVIIDLVLNHTSDQHPWFQDSASGPDSARRDWYIWSDTNPGYSGPWGQQVWHYKNNAYYYGLFWGGMPDLNLENADVTTELYDVARFWLEEMGADGFRLDAARYFVEDGETQAHTPATHSWLADFYAHAKSVSPESVMVAEIWDVSDLVATYVATSMGSETDLAFEFSLAKAILESVNEGRVTPVASAMKEIQRLFPEGGYATFLANHDQNRVADVLGRDPAKARLAATVLLTLPGVPFVYYGEEIGMTGSKPDELIRTPMQWTSGPQAGFTTGTPWQAVNEGYEEKNVEAQAPDPDSLLNHYRALISLRYEHPALSLGDYNQVQSADSRVYAFLRVSGDEQILVVTNMQSKPSTEYALSLYKSPLALGTYQMVDLLSGESVASLTVNVDGTFKDYVPLPELPGQGPLILHLVPSE